MEVNLNVDVQIDSCLSLEDEKEDLVLSQCVDEAERKDNASRVGDLISDDEIESYGFLIVPENTREMEAGQMVLLVRGSRRETAKSKLRKYKHSI